MAPTPIKPDEKPAPKGQTSTDSKRRRKIQKRLQKAEKAEDKEAIAKYAELSNKTDEELAALTSEQLQEIEMEVDWQEDDNGGSTGEADGIDNGKSGETTKTNAEKSPKDEDKPKKKTVVLDSTENADKKSEGLFVSDAETDAESDDDLGSETRTLVDPEHGQALYTFPSAGNTKNVNTVGWTGGRSTTYINMHGKKSAARYRVERYAFPPEYEDDPPEDQKASNPSNRYGDEKLRNGRPKYTKRHIRGIFGVAWKSSNLQISRDDLADINPDLVDKWTRVPTYILIAWDIDGQIIKKWEPRTCLRARWGESEADRIIYKAAKEAEDRYEQTKRGLREANSRSPSTGLAREDVEAHREKSVGPGRSSKSPPLGSKAAETLRVEFLEDYCELLGVGGFADLSISERATCTAAWREAKSSYGGGIAG